MVKKEKVVNVNRFQNQQPYNDIPCQENEVLVPFMIKSEMYKTNYINTKNIRSWKTAGISYKVGFVPADKSLFSEYMKFFWKDVNELIEPYREKRCLITNEKGEYIRCPKENDCNNCKLLCNFNVFSSIELSLDEMLYGLNDTDTSGYDPSGRREDSAKETAITIVNDLIEKAISINPRYAYILQMLSEDMPAKEIGNRLGVKKTQTYALIDKALDFAKELLDCNE